MTKAGDLDWSELLEKSDEKYKHEPTALWAADQCGGKQGGVDPLNKAEKRIKDGEEPYRPTDEEIRAAVMHNAPKQPTDEELFGHLVVTEEMAKAVQEEWDNKLNGFYEEANKPVTQEPEPEWTGREPLTKGMSEEELAKWRMYTGE